MKGNKLIQKAVQLSAQTDKLREITKPGRHRRVGKPTASAKKLSPSGYKINCEKTHWIHISEMHKLLSACPLQKWEKQPARSVKVQKTMGKDWNSEWHIRGGTCIPKKWSTNTNRIQHQWEILFLPPNSTKDSKSVETLDLAFSPLSSRIGNTGVFIEWNTVNCLSGWRTRFSGDIRWAGLSCPPISDKS